MFGHDDQSQHQDASQVAPDNGGLTHEDQALADAATTGTPSAPTDTAGEYIDPDMPGTAPTTTDAVVDTTTPASAVVAPASATVPASTDTDSLLGIKQQALQQLTPLVGHLEQNPEEKFRTTMMMIQAADNPSLIKSAYDAAQQITDEKVRAQALLDIVNEINYFTHNNENAQA